MITRENFPKKWLQQISVYLELDEPLPDDLLTNPEHHQLWKNLFNTKIGFNTKCDLVLNDADSMMGSLILLKVFLEDDEFQIQFPDVAPKVMEKFATSFDNPESFEKHLSKGISRFAHYLIEFCGRQLATLSEDKSRIVWHEQTPQILNAIFTAAHKFGYSNSTCITGYWKKPTHLLDERYLPVLNRVLDKLNNYGFDYFKIGNQTSLLNKVEDKMDAMLEQDRGSREITEAALAVIDNHIYAYGAQQAVISAKYGFQALKNFGLWLVQPSEDNADPEQSNTASPLV